MEVSSEMVLLRPSSMSLKTIVDKDSVESLTADGSNRNVRMVVYITYSCRFCPSLPRRPARCKVHQSIDIAVPKPGKRYCILEKLRQLLPINPFGHGFSRRTFP